MNVLDLPPIAAVLDGAYAGLMALASLLEPIAGGTSAALAIILVTLLVRALLIPVGVTQARTEQTRARLAPKLRELQRRFAKSPERLQRETMQLYADEKASPFAGCVPMLIQAPIVGVIYALFLHTVIAGHVNALLSAHLFGVPLGTSLASAVATGTLRVSGAAVFAILIAVILAVAEVTRRSFRPPAGLEPSPIGGARIAAVVGLLQFVTAVVAVFVPLAAALYLTVTVTWTLGQRLILRRRFPIP